MKAVGEILACGAVGVAASYIIAWSIVLYSGTIQNCDPYAYHNPLGGSPIVMLSDRRAGMEWVTGMGRPGTFLDRSPEAVHVYPHRPWWPSGAVTFNNEIEYALAAGWPCFCVHAWQTLDDRDERRAHGGIFLEHKRPRTRGSERILLPYKPFCSGLGINTAFYGTAAMLLWNVPRVVRQTLRIRRNQCDACGYPRGTESLCPECGFGPRL